MKQRKMAFLILIILAFLIVPLHALAVDPPTLSLQEDTGINTDGITSNGTMLVGGLASGATWEYSVNQGVSWTAGSGTSFVLDDATYPAGYLKVRQISAGATSAAATYPTEIVVAGNQIDNGDFQQNNVKFSTDYIYKAPNTPGDLSEGFYSVVDFSNDAHSGFEPAYDHTYGNEAQGLFFVANASGDITDIVWQSTSAITVDAGVAYRFEAYLMSLTNDMDVANNYPFIRFQIGDGTNWADLNNTDVAWVANEEGIWHVTYADGVFSDSGTFYIRMLNDQPRGWNDLGLDDIYFGLRGAAPSASDATTNPTATPTTFSTSTMLSTELAFDTGASTTDTITNNGQVNVNGLVHSWEYSLNGGSTWSTGTGSSFTVSGDGTKSVIVHQRNDTDTAWLASTAPLDFTLDTAAPVFSSGSVSGNTIVITFNEKLNANTPPSASNFSVSLNGSITAVSSLNVSGNTVTLIMPSSLDSATSFLVNYTKTPAEPAVTDVAGNEYTSFDFSLFKVTYNGNRASIGTPPANQVYSYGDTVTVSDNSGGLYYTDNMFSGWNTAPDGSGTAYPVGATFSMPGRAVTLYAQWDAIPIPKTGDSPYTVRLILLAAASLAGLAAMFNRLRKSLRSGLREKQFG